jgi:transcriptional regulator with XRE-family HTH domain
MVDTKILGMNVRKYRKEANLTQGKAAELVGISPLYLRQIELGNKVPRLETFIRIAEVLHTPTDKLLCGNLSWSSEVKASELQEKLGHLPYEKKQYIETVPKFV